MKIIQTGLIVLSAFVAEAQLSVPFGGTAGVTADEGVTLVSPAVEGTLRKDGAATVIIGGPMVAGGKVDIREGVVLIDRTATGTAEVPEAVRAKAACWFDAGINIVVDGTTGMVSQWLDVREADTNAPYSFPRAVADSSDTAPSTGTVDGVAYVDFGGCGSGEWLKWVTSDDKRFAPATIRNVFIVMGGQSGGQGVLLGDYNWSQESGTNAYNFIPSSWTRSSPVFFWSRSDTPAGVRGGKTRLNGRIIDGCSTAPILGWQLLDVTTLDNVLASNFANDRGVASRAGGARYCEVLIFTNKLSEVERMTVANYLQGKWLSLTNYIGTIETAAGATTTVSVADGLTQAIGSMAGDGTLVKTGAGDMRIEDSFTYGTGSVILEEGSILHTEERSDVPFTLSTGGLLLDVATNRATASTLEDASLIRKAGTGTLAVRSIDANVKMLSVEEGAVSLKSPQHSDMSASHVMATIPNASFESHAAFSGTYSTTIVPDEWTVSPSGKNGKAGPCQSPSTSNPWFSTNTIPDGATALFIQCNAVVSTTITIPQTGRYRFSLYALARSGYSLHSLRISIGDKQLAVLKTYDPVFRRYEWETPSLEAGSYLLQLEGMNASTLRSTVIDNLRMELIEPQVSDIVVVSNGSFEWSDLFGSDANPNWFALPPSNAGWTFTGPSGSGGIAEVRPDLGIACVSVDVPDGTRCTLLRNGCGLSQSITFPSTEGKYKLRFKAAIRKLSGPTQIEVLLDGKDIGGFLRIWNMEFNETEIQLPTLDTTTETLQINSITNKYGYSGEVLIDDMRIEKVGGNLVTDGGFEAQHDTVLTEEGFTSYEAVSGNEGVRLGGWFFKRGTDGRGCGISQHSGDNLFGRPFQGQQMALFQGLSSASQEVSLLTAGVYAIRFRAAARPSHLGHQMEVLWGGTRLGTYTTADTVWREHSFRFTAVADGECKMLMFRGLNDVGIETSDPGSVLDNVFIERVGDIPFNPPDVPSSLVVSVSNRAKLDLDYSGEIKIDSLILGGHHAEGIIHAADYPEFLSGTGLLSVPHRGMLIRMK